jgi:uncharacterized protein YdaU (DUF1376 family)
MKLPYFNYYPRDWIADTRHLTFEQRGVYHDLLCFMWIYGEDCSLPDEPKTICGLLNLAPAKWRAIRAVLVEGFAPVLRSVHGRLVSKRLQEEFDKANKKSKVRQDAANARWHNPDEPPADDANAMQMHPVSNAFAYAKPMHPEAEAYTEVLTRREEVKQTSAPRASKPAPEVDNFTPFAEEVWAIYPDRNGKKLNKKKFVAMLRSVPARDWDAVLIGVQNFSTSRQAVQGYAPDAFRWVRDETWRDWQTPEVERPNNGSRSNKPTVSEVLTDIFRASDPAEATNHRRLQAGGADVAYRRGA